MRFHFVVAVAASTLVASLNASSVVMNSKLTAPGVSTGATKQRFLRSYNMADLEEDRALNINSIFGVNKIKTAYTQSKLSSYLKKGKSEDEVFTKLKLGNQANEKLFQDPKFLAWVKYIDDNNAKTGSKKMSIIPTLTKQYGDDTLARMLEAASKTDGSKLLVSKLQEQQVKFWRSQNLPLGTVFTRLKLDRNLDDILTNPSFFAFNRYLVDYNVRYSKSVTMIEAFKGHYGDEAVAKMLQTTMTKSKDVETQKMAGRLQDQQFEVWQSSRITSDTLFKQLNLNKVDVTLENPNFLVWGKYLQNYSGEDKKAFDKLWQIFGEKKLAAMLVAPRETVGGNEMITFLQNAMIKKWISMIRTPEDVSSMLGSGFGGKTFAAAYKWNFQSTFKMS
ncbi:hypothetical protein PHMEG_00019377 [Phytophthora megakarya]|uniref:RxLR effector protein n=1 Tax=Phytophthora megakarya TaxID=4795 RepID=A0A225VSY4_9STRA|nr:hypothetical protein PHMEG_00019377 [Phytophthora megakarya]